MTFYKLSVELLEEKTKSKLGGDAIEKSWSNMLAVQIC